MAEVTAAISPQWRAWVEEQAKLVLERARERVLSVPETKPEALAPMNPRLPVYKP